MLKRLLKEARDGIKLRDDFIGEKGMTDEYEEAWGKLLHSVHATARPELLRMRSTLEQRDLNDAKSALKGGLEKFLNTYVRARYGNAGPPSCEIRFQNMNYAVDVPMSSGGGDDIPTVGSTVMGLFNMCKCQTTPTTRKKILKNMTGSLKAGSLTLLLGPPGSGKTSFLKAMAGRVGDGKHETLSGDITYAGRQKDDFFMPKMVSYVDQVDEHMPSLTVRETLEFACHMQTGFQEEPSSSNSGMATSDFGTGNPYQLRIDIILQLLGLSRCKDTIIGNAAVRGVSGGERKRVTTGEMLVGKTKAFMLDEISTGLDSAATFDIIKTLKNAGKHLGVVFVVSLLQPAPEVYNLFDDVILLDKGSMIYHGPRENCLGYFQSLGYQCPPRKDVADFLQEITTPEGAEFRAETRENGRPIPRTNSEFVGEFQRSAAFLDAVDALNIPPATPFNDWDEFDQQFVTNEFAISFIGSLRANIKRSFTLLKRDKIYVGSRMGQAVVMGLLIGTLFYDTPPEQVTTIIGCLFTVLMIIGLGGMASVPAAFAKRNVFYKHRTAGFNPTAAYVISDTFVEMPLSIFECCTMGSMVYFMVGLTTTSGILPFIIFSLVILMLSITMNMFFKLIAAAVPR
jgi:ABC-type multidrug transport system ATPase subunit